MDKIWIYVWKQRKLGDVAEIIGGGTPKTSINDYWDGEINWYAPAEIGNLIYVSSSQRKITKLGLNKSSAKILPVGTVLFTSRAGIGKTAILACEGCTNQGFQSIVPRKGMLDSYFIFVRTEELKRYAETVGAGSTFVEVSGKQMMDMELMLPITIEEQQKIGNYFAEIDSLITFHHRKLNILNKICRYAWEQRKLGEVCSRVQGNDGRMDLPTLTISAANGWMNQEERFSGNIAGKEQKNYTLLHKGELSYNHGNSKLAKYGTVFSLQSYKEALVPRVYHSFKVEEGSPDFLEYYFATKLPDRELGKLISSGARMDGLLNIGYNEFMGIQMLFPSVEEQKQISNYFRTLDYLITLHQRKYDETKKLKKCMLQKMFPKEGEKVPEIRFSGFTGDWKQRKLGEIVNRITRKNSKLISELPLTISAQQGLIDQNEFFDKRVASKDVSGYYLIKNGEFAYNKSTSNDAPWGAIKRLDRYENGVLSTLYIVFEIKDETLVNSDFLVAYYNTNLWHKGIHEIATEGARNHGLLNIAPTDFFKTKLKLPADIEEQQEIGEYFKKIDSLITFHQQKCDELKNIKKFMLQNMFVSEK